MTITYDALLVVSFGGPEKPEEVMPFLEKVTRGRNIPRERLAGVAEHYYHFGGRSPINDQNRALVAALRSRLEERGLPLQVYWGNRNWHPMLGDTIRQMQADGVRRAAAFITSAFGSYSGCRQYLEDIERARAEAGPEPLAIEKLPTFGGRLGFLGPMAENVIAAIGEFGHAVPVAFTAHSIPKGMADTSPYVRQLEEACRFLTRGLGISDWRLVWQSRSGPPTQPWLEPDILDHIRSLHAAGVRELVIAPIGFISDHMEVLYDLDTEAADLCRELGIRMVRARTVGTAPAFVNMICDLLLEQPRVCAEGCCVPLSAGPPAAVPGGGTTTCGGERSQGTAS